MSGPLRKKARLWREASKGVKSKFTSRVKDSPLDRGDVRTALVQEKMERGDRIQEIRLKRYPSIDVDLDKVYAGSIDGTPEDVQEMLMEAGFRNGPLAYVEVTEEFGPDDGSFWLHIVTETGKFPFIENRAGMFRRIKDQIHAVVWWDPELEMTHIGAHREQSALMQPARHAKVNDADAERGIRDLRDKISDTFNKELPQPLK